LVLALRGTDAVLFRFSGAPLDDVACIAVDPFAKVSVTVDVFGPSDCDRSVLVYLPSSRALAVSDIPGRLVEQPNTGSVARLVSADAVAHGLAGCLDGDRSIKIMD
jgi:hypothetical protein